MTHSPGAIERTVVEFLTRAEKITPDFGPDTPLYADGIGLDSLETAELSAILEDDFGADPFAADVMPETLADLVAFFAPTQETSSEQ